MFVFFRTWCSLGTDMFVLYVQRVCVCVCVCTLGSPWHMLFLQLPVRNRHSCGLMTMNEQVFQQAPTKAANLVAVGVCGSRPPCLPAWLLYYATLCMPRRHIASELQMVNQWQQDRLAARDTAAAGHLLQHPAMCQVSPRDVTLFTWVYQFIQGNGAVAVYPNTTRFIPFPLFLSSFSSLFMTSSPVMMMLLQLLPSIPPSLFSFPIIISSAPSLTGPPSAGCLCSVIGSFSHFSVWRWRQETQREGGGGRFSQKGNKRL